MRSAPLSGSRATPPSPHPAPSSSPRAAALRTAKTEYPSASACARTIWRYVGEIHSALGRNELRLYQRDLVPKRRRANQWLARLRMNAACSLVVSVGVAWERHRGKAGKGRKQKQVCEGRCFGGDSLWAVDIRLHGLAAPADKREVPDLKGLHVSEHDGRAVPSQAPRWRSIPCHRSCTTLSEAERRCLPPRPRRV